MQVTLNDKPIDVAVACATLQDLLAWIEEEKLARGHVITVIEIDGEELDDESEQDALLRSCSEISSVAFQTARAVDLAREGLEQAVELLPTLTDALRESAKLLRDGHTASGLDLLYECLGHVEWYIGLIAALDIYFSELTPDTDDELMGDTPLTNRISVPGGLPLRGAGDQGFGELRTFASLENLRT